MLLPLFVCACRGVGGSFLFTIKPQLHLLKKPLKESELLGYSLLFARATEKP